LPTGNNRSERDTPQDAHRCGQPGQQHGRRIPSLSSKHTLSTCCRLVSSFLTEMVQQIHSLRASGVMSSQTASAFASDASAFRRSAGRSCTTPPEIRTLVIVLSHRLKEQVSDTRIQLGFRDYRRQSGHYPMFEFCPDSRQSAQNAASMGELAICTTPQAHRYHREEKAVYLPRIERLNWESEMTEFGARSGSGSTSFASSPLCCLLELPSHGPKRNPLCRTWQERWALRWVQELVILSS
jgi:hypothetical protein